jgi:hypothetical protein
MTAVQAACVNHCARPLSAYRLYALRVEAVQQTVGLSDPMPYTAADIRVLSDQEVDERFTWARVAALAEKYSRPTDWIARGLEACRRADVEPEYFIARYLERDAGTPFDSTVDEAMREILAETRLTSG